MSEQFNKFDLEFKLNANEKTLAIWFRLGDKDVLVNPYGLFKSLISSENITILVQDATKILVGDLSFQVDVSEQTHSFTWTISSYLNDMVLELVFERKEYRQKVIETLKELFEALQLDIATAYKNYIELAELEKLIEQIPLLNLFESLYKITTKDIVEETFHFECIIVEECSDMNFIIGFGNKKYETLITEWSTNMEHVRHTIESLVYYAKNEQIVKLYYEDSPTTITISPKSILESTVSMGSGTAFKYKDFFLVNISPNDFSKGADLIAFCNPKQFVKELYEGLLIPAIGRFVKDDEFDWKYLYNQIKSPVIEEYINGKENLISGVKKRQTIISHIITIKPDYDVLYEDETGVCYRHFGDMIDLYDDDNLVCSINIPGVDEWYKKYIDSTNWGTLTIDINFDLDSWNTQGLEIAKAIRNQLPDNFDLWYAYPYEDEKNRNRKPILIYKQ
ncbi:MAG: hypothetical protein WCK78_15275 [Paludibacter sp.]